RKDAEQKLRATEANLARLEDLMSQLDAQIGTLRRQARAAERYKALSDRIRIAEARLVFARWRDAAAAAEAARGEAQSAEARVGTAQAAMKAAQAAQAASATALAEARDELADRRDDAAAHGHRMAQLTSQLEAVEQRLKDLQRQQHRLEEDRGDADRLTRDAAEAQARIERELAGGEQALVVDENRRPLVAAALDDADRNLRQAELALANATADQAGVEAEWRVAEAELSAARQRLSRLENETRRQQDLRDALALESDTEAALAKAEADRANAAATLDAARTGLEAGQARKADLQAARDSAGAALAAARADLAGVEREWQALDRDRQARAKQAAGKHGPAALDRIRAAPGFERALAAVLGRDAKAPIAPAPADQDGRFWTGAAAPASVANSLAAHVTQCPPELAARLALVHVADADDGRPLAPGEWLVTTAGRIRRWDGFVARGEGAAEAARLEAENRLSSLDAELPALRSAVASAEASTSTVQAELAALQPALIAAERAVAQASEAERAALRSVDQAEGAKARLETRHGELAAAAADLVEQVRQAETERAAAEQRLAALPDPESGRSQLAAARSRHDTARQGLQSASAALAAHDQALAVARERTNTLRSDIKSWQARAGDAANRLAQMARRAEELEEERAIIAAKPASLLREIEDGDATRARIAAELAAAEARVAEGTDTARHADIAFAQANEALASAREVRAGAAARAENEEARRQEMAGISGERFQCPPPLLAERFAFDSAAVGPAAAESAEHDKLVADRERLGPVNLVAADELAGAEARHGASIAEQAELGEAVNRLRGSIGNLNREGRERLRAAFEAVDQHFRRLFTRLFEGGQAHLALIDSDDPLEAGLEIYAQPPGKRLQSLTLLSGGEQALTAVALIFALFLTNPAPICVLDEVDAPLDDANIERFCDLLDAMVGETDTRYLIVTHNAVTMSRMHRLFGVTMIERGVSRLVSVDLEAAEELLAAE
uniref:chromosome segregation protein n=1 Tax=Novosphingobium sp. TaxID=1874826 RepID=UPI0025F21039